MLSKEREETIYEAKAADIMTEEQRRASKERGEIFRAGKKDVEKAGEERMVEKFKRENLGFLIKRVAEDVRKEDYPMAVRAAFAMGDAAKVKELLPKLEEKGDFYTAGWYAAKIGEIEKAREMLSRVKAKGDEYQAKKLSELLLS
jgi:hypothetical protein